jgi:hypothetical protein
MQIKDIFIGAKGSSINQLVKNSVVVDLQEISSPQEATKKIDEMKKNIARRPQDKLLIVVFRQ